MGLLRKQLELVKAYGTLKETLPAQNSSGAVGRGTGAAASFKENQNRKGGKGSTAAVAVATRRKAALTGSQGSASGCIRLRAKARNVLIQGSSGDGSRRLSDLMRRGLVAPGSVLRTRLKVRKGPLRSQPLTFRWTFPFGPTEAPAQGSPAGRRQDKGRSGPSARGSGALAGVHPREQHPCELSLRLGQGETHRNVPREV